MKNIFDTNATADASVFGGEPAARAVGLPTSTKLPGTLAPGGSNSTARAMVEQYAQENDALVQAAQAPAAQSDPIVGVNFDTKQVFSKGKTFKLDLGEGTANAALLDQNNDTLPEGFEGIRSSEIKNFLQREYDNLDMVDSVQRRLGQMTANYGSTLQDLGAESVGQSMQDFGGAVARNNPAKINKAQDLLDSPFQTAKEAVSEMLPDLAVAAGTTAAGAAVGAKLGVPLAAVTGGLSIPIGAIMGGLGARYFSTLFETYGSVRAEQRDAGIEDKGRAATTASGSAVWEALLGPEARLGSRISKVVGRKAAGEVAEKGSIAQARDLLAEGKFAQAGKRMGKDALQGFGSEAATEIPQTALERFGAFKDLGSAEAIDEYAVAGVKGGFGGAAAGASIAGGQFAVEYQAAQAFVENLKADTELASDTTAPSAARLAAAKRVQDVLKGSSDDPDFNQQLQEFRQKLAFLDTQMVGQATDDPAGDITMLNPEGDLFNAAVQRGEAPAPELEGVPPVVGNDPNQIGMFDETGAPTYSADPSFSPLTEPLTPLQQQALRGPDLQAPTEPTRYTVGDQTYTAAELQGADSPLGGVSPAAVQPDAGTPASGAFSDAQVEQDLEMDFTDGAKLNASIEGKTGRVSDRQTMSQDTFDAITQGVMGYGEKLKTAKDPRAKSVVEAVQRFAKAFGEYKDLTLSTVKRTSDIFNNNTDFDALGDKFVGKEAAALNKARRALEALGVAVGSAKDVETIVAKIKAATQMSKANPGKYLTPEQQKAFEKMDTNLSSGWAAAKADLFRGDSDQFRSNEEANRASTELEGTQVNKLKAAYTEGYSNPTNNGKVKFKGFLGILQYVRFNGNAYDQKLARAIREVLVASGDLPKVKFITKGTPGYDPKTNTISIRETESNSVVLHEGLHAALQWFVHNNPNHPIVKELRASVGKVVAYKGKLGANAAKVQTLLKNLMAEGNEADAVLELVSYGNTLNEFRRALQDMPKKGTPKSFYEAAQDVWKYMTSLVKQLIGADTNNEAANVISRTWELLAAAGDTFQAEQEQGRAQERTRSGKRLEAAVMPGMNPLEQDQAELLRRPGAQLPSDADLERYNRRVIPTQLSTKVLFDFLGWTKGANIAADKAAKLADRIRADYPSLTRFVSYVDSKFGVAPPVRKFFNQFKNDKQAGYKVAERLAWYIGSRDKEKVLAVIDYLDGNKNALKDDASLRELADDVKSWRDFYVQELGDEKTKAFFNSGKFSETLLFATSREQIASSAFGVRKLSSLIGQKTQTEAVLEDSWLNLDYNGDPLLGEDQQFLQVLEKNKRTGKVEHAGFIARSKYEANGAPPGTTVDPTFTWYHKSKGKDGHNFVANMTARQALDENKAEAVANALRNTMAALSNTYAARQFAQGIESYGLDEDGQRTAASVVFDNIEQANKVLGIKINPDAVAMSETNKDALKTAASQHRYRSANLWVQVPKGAKYGALSGKIIKSSVWMAMDDMSNRQPLVNTELYNGPLRWFKKSKTIYNVGTHMTNVATNVTLSFMHDIPMGTIAHATRIFALYELAPNRLSGTDRALVRAFMNSNAMLGDFSSAEVKKAISDAMLAVTKESGAKGNPDPTSTAGRVGAFLNYEKLKSAAITQLAAKTGKKIDHFATELYSAEDNVFRLAAFLKHAADRSAQTGKAPTQEDLAAAGDYAREAFLDYDIDSKAVRIARQSFLPFVSWTYAIVPLLGRMAVHQPWKIANTMLAYTIIEHVMQEIAGGDDEDELARKRGPEYLRERMFGGIGPYTTIRIPFLGDDKNPVFYKLGDYMPMAAVTRGQGPNAFMGQEWWPAAATPTGPFVSLIAALVGGVDPYTGRQLSPPTDTQWEALGERAKYVASQFMPTLPINPQQWANTENILKGRTDKTENYAALQMARWMGFKLYDFNMDDAAVAQGRAAKAIMSEYKREIGKLRRAEARFEKPDWDGFREKQLELLERMNEEMAKARGEK